MQLQISRKKIFLYTYFFNFLETLLPVPIKNKLFIYLVQCIQKYISFVKYLIYLHKVYSKIFNGFQITLKKYIKICLNLKVRRILTFMYLILLILNAKIVNCLDVNVIFDVQAFLCVLQNLYVFS